MDKIGADEADEFRLGGDFGLEIYIFRRQGDYESLVVLLIVSRRNSQVYGIIRAVYEF